MSVRTAVTDYVGGSIGGFIKKHVTKGIDMGKCREKGQYTRMSAEINAGVALQSTHSIENPKTPYKKCPHLHMYTKEKIYRRTF